MSGPDGEKGQGQDGARLDFGKLYFNNYHVRRRFLQKHVSSILLQRRALAVTALAWTDFPNPLVMFKVAPPVMPVDRPPRAPSMKLFTAVPTVEKEGEEQDSNEVSVEEQESFDLDDIKEWYTEEELAAEDDLFLAAERLQRELNQLHLVSLKLLTMLLIHVGASTSG
jgi:hypothetical protein